MLIALSIVVLLAAIATAVAIAARRPAHRRPGYLIGGPETRQQNAAALREQPAARPKEL